MDFILAMKAATSVSEDVSRAGTPAPDGVVAGDWRAAPFAEAGVVPAGLRVIIFEPSRRAIRLQHGDPGGALQYPGEASTAGNRRGGQQF
jgi:hypothetical protein